MKTEFIFVALNIFATFPLPQQWCKYNVISNSSKPSGIIHRTADNPVPYDIKPHLYLTTTENPVPSHIKNNSDTRQLRYHKLDEQFLRIRKVNRIIGGRQGNIREFPFMACLILKSKEGIGFNGGAAIISKNWAVTAAHCMELYTKDDIRNQHAFVHSNSAMWNDGFREHLITETHIHEKFNKELTDYDVAVVKVKQPFTGKYEKPIPLAKNNYEYRPRSSAIVLGWGTTKRNSTPFVVDTLKYVTIGISNFETCRKHYSKDEKLITQRMICAGAPNKDSCVYDSGGPLYQNRKLIGLVSWGSAVCAENALPGVYTKLSLFYNWIHKKIKSKGRALMKYGIVLV